MEATTAPKPATAAKPPAEPRPLRTLLPTGGMRIAVAAGGVVLIVASFASFGLSGRALVGAVFCPVMLLLAAIDVKDHLLPNAIVLPAALLVALIVAATDPAGFLSHLWAGLALFAFLFVFAAIFPAGLGMGDAKAGLLIGLALGYRTFSAMTAAFALLFLAAVWILVRGGLSARKQSIPFGPFLALGAILAFFFG
jgi:prepilin signal peptidase PulO-like enzyme (type II secretory pathway)